MDTDSHFKTVSPESFLAKEELNNKEIIEERNRKTTICVFVVTTLDSRIQINPTFFIGERNKPTLINNKYSNK